MAIRFDYSGCICDHSYQAHDDGFGCTEYDCECTADWYYDDEDD